jgi:hypothetical protein
VVTSVEQVGDAVAVVKKIASQQWGWIECATFPDATKNNATVNPKPIRTNVRPSFLAMRTTRSKTKTSSFGFVQN